MATVPENLRPILDMLIQKAWRNAARDQEGEFLLSPADLAPGTSAESMHEALQALYAHARRWVPGLEVPYLVPAIRIDRMVAGGNFEIDDESYASVGVTADLVDNAPAVLMVLSHEACHHILFQSGLMRADDVRLDEVTTDLAMFVCGFGELVLQGHSYVKQYGRGKGERRHLGYLTSETYRQIHDYVLEKRAANGLPVRSSAGAGAKARRTDKESARAAESAAAGGDGTVELWCGEAMCKRAFRTKLRPAGKPWPVQCAMCGVYLYPGDILRSAAANELEPQRAELRLSIDGRLMEGTSAALLRLARPAAAAGSAPARTGAPEKVDGAAILADMIEAASNPAAPPPPGSVPVPVRRPEPLAPVPVKGRPIVPIVLGIAILLVLVIAVVLVMSR